ncbi:MAG: hypothetical protein NTX50_13270 [Candidatus Sumerlaeota bacterium]|nr:hypothetical protein [Candidatus Sumerlaeota bacterium]
MRSSSKISLSCIAVLIASTLLGGCANMRPVKPSAFMAALDQDALKAQLAKAIPGPVSYRFYWASNSVDLNRASNSMHLALTLDTSDAAPSLEDLRKNITHLIDEAGGKVTSNNRAGDLGSFSCEYTIRNNSGDLLVFCAPNGPKGFAISVVIFEYTTNFWAKR